MAIFNQIPRDEIRKQFTHHGVFAGCVPIYVNAESGNYEVAVRNWWPEWMLDVVSAAYSMVAEVTGQDAGFHITIKQKLN